MRRFRAVSGSELLLSAVVVEVMFVWVVPCKSRVSKGCWILACVALILSVATIVVWDDDNEEDPHFPKPEPIGDLPLQVTTDGYVSSKSCRRCHPDQFASWHASYHRTMTQIVSPTTVLAPFDNIKLESRGRTYQLQRRGDEFWVKMADPDWEAELAARGADLTQITNPPLVERQIVMSTGSHHVQGYWVTSPFGLELRQLPFVYRLAERRWIPREDAFLSPPDAPRHFRLWNNSCIQCHAVRGNPRRDPQTGDYHSQVAEFGIACEACHGPGEKHVRLHENLLQDRRSGREPDRTIVNPRNCSHTVSSQICGQCHSFFEPKDLQDWFQHGYSYRPGDDLENSHRMSRFDQQRIETDLFWPDGASRVGGREYLGLIETPCYQRGKLSCITCHSMHQSDPNDQLASGMEGNQACLQCHSDSRFGDRIEEHTHHSGKSSGSLCYNCHMAHTTYALFTAIRSHRIDSPKVSPSVRGGRPNACNLCHLDQTLDWTARHLSLWYGMPDVKLSEDEETIAASLLWALRGDAAQRAIAAWHMGWEPAHLASGKSWLAPFLAQLLEDPYSAVRFVAYRSLRRLPEFDEFVYDFVGPLQERSQARDRALQRWNRSRLPADKRPGQHTLLGLDGTLNQKTLKRLLRERDNRRVYIAE